MSARALPRGLDGRTLAMLAAAGSAALLLGAFAFQAAGHAPCRMCLWQRWPHWVAIAAGLAAWAVSDRAAPSLRAGALRAIAGVGLLAALATAGLGVFHTGVERGWWEGPASCTGSGLGGLSGEDLLSLEGAAVVMCDEVAWSFAGLSMASWNALASLGLAALWVAAALAPRPRRG